MSSYVLKYSRDARVKYISHLDFVRMIHRTVRRAGLDMEFSQGFNPHPVMTVAIPLSVGVTAEGEYMKLGLKDGHTEAEIMTALNAALPPGYRICAVKKTEGKQIDFATIDRAEYIIEAECENDFEPEDIMKQPELIVMKKSKSGVKETDIKPLIFSVEKQEYDGGVMRMRMVLAAGNTATLKPETVMDAINKYLPDADTGFFLMHRKSLTAGGAELL